MKVSDIAAKAVSDLRDGEYWIIPHLMRFSEKGVPIIRGVIVGKGNKKNVPAPIGAVVISDEDDELIAAAEGCYLTAHISLAPPPICNGKELGYKETMKIMLSSDSYVVSRSISKK